MGSSVLALGSGLLESLADAVVIAGTLVLFLMLVAIGAFAYKSLRGDGVRWPDEEDDEVGDSGVTKGGDDDEWKYY